MRKVEDKAVALLILSDSGVPRHCISLCMEEDDEFIREECEHEPHRYEDFKYYYNSIITRPQLVTYFDRKYIFIP